jgi:hypothetical protein
MNPEQEAPTRSTFACRDYLAKVGKLPSGVTGLEPHVIAMRSLGASASQIKFYLRKHMGRDVSSEAGAMIEAVCEARPLPKPRPPSPIRLVNAAAVEPKTIKYIWQDRLARGMHTVIAGVGGQGKSQVAYAVIAAITTGGKWPDGEGYAPKGRCVILSAEEGKHDMIVPRLIAAGADLSMVEILTSVQDGGKERKFSLQNDLAALKTVCKQIGDVVLIDIDPVSSYMGGDLDTHRNSAVRTVLDPLTQLAEDLNCCVLSITHFNKNASAKAVNRVMESAAFVNAPRASFAVLPDDEDESKRLLLCLKTNMGKQPLGLRFYVEAAPGGFDKEAQKEIMAPRVVWDGLTDKTADEVTAAEQGKGTPKLDEAIAWLENELMTADVHLAADMTARAVKRGIATQTLRRAREKLNVRAYQQPGKSPPVWLWSLTPADDFDFG